MSIQESAVPRLWSDFDGTAVELASKTTLQGWLNYPMVGIQGYGDFLRGAQGRGVEIAGVVSRRLNTYLNRRATIRTIADLGLSDFFGDRQILLVNNENRKARHIVEQSQTTRIGIIDDRPHRIGAALLQELKSTPRGEVPHQIVLGAVMHEKTQEYIDRLVEASVGYGAEVAETPGGYTLHNDATQITVVGLSAYSLECGQEFADCLLRV